ncbi:MAG: hypothetical protein AAFX87_16570 [Bacteroidota bacterium]
MALTLRILFVTAIILMPALAIGQDGYADGYFISFSGDTTFTKIRVINKRKYKKIGYINEVGKRRKFSADDVKEYRINDKLVYASFAPYQTRVNRRFFAKVVEDGEARLLYYDLKKRYYVKKKDDIEAQWVRKWDFRKRMMAFFKDNEELRQLIRKRKLKHRDIELIVHKYNTWYNDYFIPYVESNRESTVND